MKDHGIYKYLDASTAHITERDNELLEACANSGDSRCGDIAVFPFDFGYFIFVIQIDVDLTAEHYKEYFGELSESFRKLYMKAHANQCYMIRLDCDGFEHDDLDHHEW